MMYLDAPPRLIETKVFSPMPEAFRRKGARTDWADANRRGQPTDCFIEGPSFDADGNLYVVDIPFGMPTAISMSAISRSDASSGSRLTANGRWWLNMTAGPTA